MTDEDTSDVGPVILAPSGRPARQQDAICPRCGAGRDKRRPSGGFGRDIHDVCGVCGYEWKELTCG